MATTFTLFYDFKLQLAKEQHQFSTDTFKWLASNTAPNAATNTVKADITEIAAGNGYSAGGVTISGMTVTGSSGTITADCDDEVLTASGGPIATFQYLVCYNDTNATDMLVGYINYGIGLSIPDGTTHTIAIPATGLFYY